MREGIVEALSSLVDVRYLLLYQVFVLGLALSFFTGVWLLGALLRRPVSLSKAAATIKIALAGLLLLLLGTAFRVGPPVADTLRQAVGLLVVACAANLVAYLAVDLYLHRRKRGEVPSIQRELVTLLVYVLFAVSYLRLVLRIDVATIFTTTTILTAALAFAMQTTIANVLAGFHVQGDPNLRKGTWVALRDRGLEGAVENVGFRYTTLRTVDNHKVLVPNHHLMQNVVVGIGNREEREFGAVHLKVQAGFEQPPERVKGILLPILKHEKGIAADPPPSVWVTGFGESGVEYDLKYFLEDPGSALPVRGRVLEKAWYAMAREGIAFPYPHREILEKVPRELFPRDEERIAESIRRAEILGEIGEARLSELAARARRATYGPGEIVVRENDEGDSLFLVKRGCLDVSVGGVPVGTLRAGEVFGEMSLLTGEPRGATVSAAEVTVLLEVSKRDIEPILRSDPALVERLGTILARRSESNLERLRMAEAGTTAASRRELFLNSLREFFGI